MNAPNHFSLSLDDYEAMRADIDLSHHKLRAIAETADCPASIRAILADSHGPTYEEITRSIASAPKTWAGGLLVAAIRACVDGKFFADLPSFMKFVESAAMKGVRQ